MTRPDMHTAEQGSGAPDDDGFPAAMLLRAQAEILDRMADGAPLRETLTRIATLVEELAPPALCSILLLQPDGKRLRPAAAPSLPEAFCASVDGLEIGPSVGSCGTAAYRKEPVIVTDIATDPLWEKARDFTLSFGLRACWSLPIVTQTGAVLGTIAMYYDEPRAPGDATGACSSPVRSWCVSRSCRTAVKKSCMRTKRAGGSRRGEWARHL